MAIGKVKTTVLDGGGPAFDFTLASVFGIIGQAEGGITHQIYNEASFGNAKSTLKSGFLLDYFYDAKVCGADRCKLLCAVDDVAGETGTPVHEKPASPGSATAAEGSGIPKSTRDYVIKIVNGGDMADPCTVTYQLSEDGGLTYGATQKFPDGASPVTLDLPNGADVAFTEGAGDDFKTGDKWHVSTIGPGVSTGNILGALDVLKYDNAVRSILILDESTAAEVASYIVKANWMKDQNRPVYFAFLTKSYETFFDENFTAAKVVLEGTGPEFSAGGTIDGIPQNRKVIVIKITFAGALGTAKYKMSEDGGQTYGTEQLLPADGEVYLPNGTLATFAAGAYVVDDTYTFGKTVDEWISELEAEYASTYSYRMVGVAMGFNVADHDGVPRERQAAGMMQGTFAKISLERSCGCVLWGTIPHALDTFPGEADGLLQGDVAKQDALDDARLVTTRFWPGYGFVVSRGVTLATVSSDYKRVEKVRVLNELDRALHTVAIQLVEHPFAPSDAPLVKAKLEEPIKIAKAKGWIVDGTVEFDPEQDVEGAGAFVARATIYFVPTIPGVELYIGAAKK